MKIMNLDKGEAYQLTSDTKIEVERTNPFLNDWGEQSVPLSLPDTEMNRRILGYPDMMGNKAKMQRVNASIADGEFYIACKQAVLSSTHNKDISTSFYMNEGAFYTNMKKVNLKDIFDDMYVPGVSTVEEGISFCRSLQNNTNEDYAIFPVVVDNDSGLTNGYAFKWINAYGVFKNLGVPGTIFQLSTETGADFYNAIQRTEYVNSVPITITPGYYISPFIRANTVLKRIFEYFGYTLVDNFFTETLPFNKMVFVNNVIDVLIKGKIAISQLVPDVTCQDILNLYRKKFHCEFIPNEISKTVTIKLFDEIIQGDISCDLTGYLTEEPEEEYTAADAYKRIALTAGDTVGNAEAAESYDTLPELIEAFPTAEFNKMDGCFYRTGFSGSAKVKDKVAECSMKFDLGGELDAESIEIPECMPELRWQKWTFNDNYSMKLIRLLYVGAYHTANTKLMVSGVETETSTSSQKTKSMLAIPYLGRYTTLGTVTNYDYELEDTNYTINKLWDFSLCYYGEDGIFEKFYRKYDDMLRNSMHLIKAKLLLDQSIKRSLPSYKKVMLRNQQLLINKFKYTLGGKNEPVESELYSIRLYMPVLHAGTIAELLPNLNTGYHWTGHFEYVDSTETEYNNSGDDKNRTFVVNYPPVPSSQYTASEYYKQVSYFNSGQEEYVSGYYTSLDGTVYPEYNQRNKYVKLTVWLTCDPDN